MPANKLTVPNTLIGWLKQLGIAALYMLFGYVIHHNFTSNGIVSVVWWGSGLALGALLIGGRHYLWGILLGAMVVNALTNDTLVGALGTTLASILEVILGAWLLTSNNKFSLSLDTLPDYLRLIALGGAVASIIGAIIGVLALLFGGFITPADYFGYAFLWWMGDTLGVVLVTPFILAWWQTTKWERLNGKQLLEVVIFVGITFIAGQIIFLGWFNESLIFEPRAFMMFLFITWVAIRLGIRTTTFVLNMIAIQALTGAYLKVGYFANEIARSGLHNYWLFMLILSGVGMVLAVYVNDIKKKELNLRENETHLRLSQINGGIGTWEADLVTNKQKWSENCLSLLGFPALSEPTWNDFLAAVHPEDRQRVIDVLQAHNERDRKYEVEYRIVANGVTRWIRSAGQIERNTAGKLSIMRGIMQDITKRRESEDVVRESKDRMRMATEATGVGIWQWNVITHDIWWDTQMFRIYGIPSTSAGLIPYSTWSGSVLPEDLPRQEEVLQDTVRRLGSSTTEFRILKIDNSECRYIQAAATVRLNYKGQAEWVLGTNLDITERKRAEAALLDADRRKDEFLCMLAHELRNPLTPISNATHILGMLKLEEPRIDWIQKTIERQVTHLTRMVDDLLDASRIVSGKITLKKEWLDLAELVKQVVKTAHALIEAKRHHLDVRFPERQILVEGDPVRLAQVLFNLLDNAIKYSPEGGQIEIVVQIVGTEVEVQVRDHGAGIQAELLPKIFDMFQQAERTLDRSQGGLGIGLTLVKRLVELHGGQVTASSPGVGQGSTFSIRLSALEEVASLHASEIAPPALPNAVMRVLVVDDDLAVRESMGLLLEMKGYDVRMADTGEFAIKLIGEFHPSVILLDIGLPEEDGYEVARRIRRLPGGGDLLLVAVSGYGQTEALTRSKEAGFDHHLVKPVPLNSLLDLLSERGRIIG